MSPRPRFRLGLVVGKFAPLHLGHEHLIRGALAGCDEVLVLGYSKPNLTGITLARQSSWFAQRFPSVTAHMIDDDWLRMRCEALGTGSRALPPNDAPDEQHQDFLCWMLSGPVGAVPDAIWANEHYVFPTAARMSRALGRPVTPVCVDQSRAVWPVRATDIRRDVHAHRHWLSPEVYRDFVRRVVFLGAESSGKTTLAQALALASGGEWVPEFGREWWVRRQGLLDLHDLRHIARTQVAHEEAACLTAHRHLWCDTSPLTTLGYAGWLLGQSHPELEALADRPYDLTVLCEPDFGFQQDGTRQNADFAQSQQRWYERELTTRGMPFMRVGGPVSARVAAVKAACGLNEPPGVSGAGTSGANASS